MGSLRRHYGGTATTGAILLYDGDCLLAGLTCFIRHDGQIIGGINMPLDQNEIRFGDSSEFGGRKLAGANPADGGHAVSMGFLEFTHSASFHLGLNINKSCTGSLCFCNRLALIENTNFTSMSKQ